MKSTSNFFSIFITGAIVGIALGVLFAPAEGKYTRQRVKDLLRKYGFCDSNDNYDDIASGI